MVEGIGSGVDHKGGFTVSFAVDRQVVEGIGSGLNIRGVLELVLQLTTRWLKV